MCPSSFVNWSLERKENSVGFEILQRIFGDGYKETFSMIQYNYLIGMIVSYVTYVSIQRINQHSQPIVTTKLGKVRGLFYQRKDGAVSSVFLGIPYAQPPVGQLRFEKPQPLDPWPGELDATKYGPGCIPSNRSETDWEISEDCLKLNIISPVKPKKSPLLPVLLWIHAGGYQVGAASNYPYQALADIYNKKDVIVVTIQYRLGFLGFFSDGMEIGGNFGLWDQVAALQFIHENIANFGGDPKKITVWGLSAGGSSAGQLALSPHANKYINKIISMSGSSFSSWAFNEAVVDHSLPLSTITGCSNTTRTGSLKKCMKGVTIEQLFDAVEIIVSTQRSLNMLKFTPRIDRELFPGTVEQMLQNAPNIPSMIGVSKMESLFFTLLGKAPQLQEFAIQRENFGDFDETALKLVLKEVFARQAYYRDNCSDAYERMRNKYFEDYDNSLNSSACLNVYTKLFSDTMFNVAAVREARARSDYGNDVYFYVTKHYDPRAFDENFPVKSATHISEYPYILGVFPFENFGINDENEAIITDMWQEWIVNFVKTGVPSYNGKEWPKFNSPEYEYQIIDCQATIDTHPFNEELLFWDEMKDEFGYDIITLKKT